MIIFISSACLINYHYIVKFNCVKLNLRKFYKNMLNSHKRMNIEKNEIKLIK
jgi:hypothetical protein